MGNWKKKTEEVFYPERTDELVLLSTAAFDNLRETGKTYGTGKARYCCHVDEQSQLHEMFIYHESGTVIAPHKVSSGSESYLILQGCIDLVFYSEEGELKQVIRLSPFGGDDNFFIRMPKPVFRGIVVVEDTLFVEVREGPFDPSRMIWASWDKPKRLQSQVQGDSMIKSVR